MFDPQRLLGQLLGDSFGGLGRKLGETNRSLSQMGGVGGFGGGAKLGAGLGLLGVAMAAFEHFKERPAPPPPAPNAMLPPPPPPPTAPPSLLEHMPAAFPSTGAPHPAAQLPTAPAAPVDQPALVPDHGAVSAMHLLRSMIAAAHADGVLDAPEREAIVGRAREAGLPPEDLMALGAELLAPRTLSSLVAETPAGLERETYAAALLAIRVDHAAEQSFLDQLAAALRLTLDDRQLIHQQLGV